MQKSINVFANEAQKAISVECYDSRPFIAPLKVGTVASLARRCAAGGGGATSVAAAVSEKQSLAAERAALRTAA